MGLIRCMAGGLLLIGLVMFALCVPAEGYAGEKVPSCVKCHSKVTPGIVSDWKNSGHSEEGVICSDCHGDKHSGRKTVHLVQFPDEYTCGECHEEQLNQFLKGKHSKGWVTLIAIPVTHLEPDELIEGGKGCGGCHSMGIKPPEEKERLKKMGVRYQNNSCDSCHTRHLFSVKEARNPRACQQCHMGFDHPQWEMWSSSKHGTRWFAKARGNLPKDALAPTCQDCHLPGGTHENHTAWGFCGVRLPLPEDKEWAQDRIVILKALGILNPITGEATERMEIVKSLDMARLTNAAWVQERKRMLSVCKKCHSLSFAKKQLQMGDSMIRKADRLMAQAIEVVAALYRDGILKKPTGYSFAYPDLLYFMRTGGGRLDQASHIDQMLLKMYLKHRMRTYQGVFHASPDYAYWYGWAMMTEDLVKIREEVSILRSVKAREMKNENK